MMDYKFVTEIREEQIEQLHELYRGEWWSRTRTLEEVRTVVQHSDLVFGFSDHNGRLIAFTRVLTDRVFKAWLFDVIVHPDHRGEGLGRLLMERVLEHPVLKQVQHVELYCLPERFHFYRSLGFSDELGELKLFRRAR